MRDPSAAPLLIRALRREPVERTPIWIMRQAGRYLPEYREVRREADFLTLCRTPDLSAKVALDAVAALDVDAAILFSDILIPVQAMGLHVAFPESGPDIDNPVRNAGDVDALRIPDPEDDLAFVAEAVRRLRQELAPDKAVLGFAGAPFTTASYMVEGRSSRDFLLLKSLLLQEPMTFHRLLEKVAQATTACVLSQVDAGAQAIQLFDSWAGCLAPDDYEEFALRHVQPVFAALRARGVPSILFASGAAGLLERMARSGADCIAVDWRVDLGEAWRRIGHDRAIQGNLDPIALFGPPAAIARRARAILDAAAGRPGHVFNLGHGIHKDTPVEHARALIAAVRDASAR